MMGGPQQSLPSISQSPMTSVSVPRDSRAALAERNKARHQKREAMYDYPEVTEPREALKKKILGPSASTGSMRLGGVKLMPVKGHPSDEQMTDWMRLERKRADERAEKKWRKKFEEWQKQGFAPPSKRAAELDLEGDEDTKSDKSGDAVSPGNRGKSRHTPTHSEGSATDHAQERDQLPPLRPDSRILQQRAESAEAEITKVRVENLKLMQENQHLKEEIQHLKGDVQHMKEQFEGIKYDLFIEKEANTDLERRIQQAAEECDYWRDRAHRREEVMEADSVERENCSVQIEGISRMIESLNALAAGDLSGPGVSTMTAAAQGMTMSMSALPPRKHKLKTQPWRISYAKRSSQFHISAEPATPAGRLPLRPNYDANADDMALKIQCAWRSRTARNDVKRQRNSAKATRLRAKMMREQLEREREERQRAGAERERREAAVLVIQTRQRSIQAKAVVAEKRKQKAAEEKARLRRQAEEQRKAEEAKERERKREAAAVLLQKHARGGIAREQVAAKRKATEQRQEAERRRQQEATPQAASSRHSSPKHAFPAQQDDDFEGEQGDNEFASPPASPTPASPSAAHEEAVPHSPAKSNKSFGGDDDFDDEMGDDDNSPTVAKGMRPGGDDHADPAEATQQDDYEDEEGGSPKVVPTYDEKAFQKRLEEELAKADVARSKQEKARREKEEKETQKKLDAMVKERVAEETQRLTMSFKEDEAKIRAKTEEEVQKLVKEQVQQQVEEEKRKLSAIYEQDDSTKRQIMEEEEEKLDSRRRVLEEEQEQRRRKFEEEQEARRKALDDEEARMKAMIQEEEARMERLRQEMQQQLTEEQSKMRLLVAQQEENIARRLEDVLLARLNSAANFPIGAGVNGQSVATLRLEEESESELPTQYPVNDNTMMSEDEHAAAERVLAEQLQATPKSTNMETTPKSAHTPLSPHTPMSQRRLEPQQEDAERKQMELTGALSTNSLQGTIPRLYAAIQKEDQPGQPRSPDHHAQARQMELTRALTAASLQGTIPRLAAAVEEDQSTAAPQGQHPQSSQMDSWLGSLPTLSDDSEQPSQALRALTVASLQGTLPSLATSEISRPTGNNMQSALTDLSAASLGGTIPLLMAELQQLSPAARNLLLASMDMAQDQLPRRGVSNASMEGGIHLLASASINRPQSFERGLTNASMEGGNHSLDPDHAEQIGVLEGACIDEYSPPPGRTVTSYGFREEDEEDEEEATNPLLESCFAAEENPEVRDKAKANLSESLKDGSLYKALNLQRPAAGGNSGTDSQAQEEEDAEELRMMCAERLMTAMSTGELETAIDDIERHRGTPPGHATTIMEAPGEESPHPDASRQGL